MRLELWEKLQPAVQGVDQSKTPLDDGTRYYMRSECIDQWRAESIARQLEFDLGVRTELDVDESFTMAPGEDRRLFVIRLTLNGVKYALVAGDLFAELSQPYGWLPSDDGAYRIGVDEWGEVDRYAGRFTPSDGTPTRFAIATGVVDSGRTLPVQWNPDMRQVAAPVPTVITEKPAPIPFGSGAGAVGHDPNFDQQAAIKEILGLVKILVARS